MPTPADPADTVERFARLSALLADPFDDRAAVLGDVGLDAQGWQDLEQRWAAILGDAGNVDLAGRFTSVVDETLRGMSGAAVPETERTCEPGGGPCFPMPRGASPLVGDSPDIDKDEIPSTLPSPRWPTTPPEPSRSPS
jgi:hypothetical protein